MTDFQKQILEGIPAELPEKKPYDMAINHAPKRKDILTDEEKVLAVRNALRYFPTKFHSILAEEFAQELHDYGRIYMYRFRPDYEMYARPIDEYPAKSRQAAAIMAMIQNNLDPRVAQHPHELIIYGGNGAIFQNWAQYRLAMKYLAEMTDEQTLAMYSGHPMGLFPSHKDAPRVVVTNGMVIPNYSKQDDWERFNAMGVSQYGQMTAGSYMYIGPQGIVHGTTITVMNAARKQLRSRGIEGTQENMKGMLFVTAGLGGMSGAQPKAGNIAGVVSVTAEINPLAARKRHEQGWVDELHENLDELMKRIRKAMTDKEVVSLAYVGNVVDLWERLADEGIDVDLGSDQTSLHNPWAGGYYPVGHSLEESKRMMAEEPEHFKECVRESLRRQVAAINRLTAKGMYFFDYGNAFLLESSRAGADILKPDVGSQARILYADCEGRTRIALAFNEAIKRGEITAPIVLGRDHHDVSGTDSPFRETSNIYDGSQFTADMAIQNVIGDSFRGATWVSIHNGGGVGWGEVINGGFGMVIDGSADSDRHITDMLFWDVNNGIARRSWARNEGALHAITREMGRTPSLTVTVPVNADETLVREALGNIKN